MTTLSVGERQRRSERRFNGVLTSIAAIVGGAFLWYSGQQDREAVADVMRYAGAGLLIVASYVGTVIGLDSKSARDGVLSGIDTNHDVNARFLEAGELPKTVE